MQGEGKKEGLGREMGRGATKGRACKDGDTHLKFGTRRASKAAFTIASLAFRRVPCHATSKKGTEERGGAIKAQ